MNQEFIEREFDILRNKIYEKGGQELADKVTELEFKLLKGFKKYRDNLRDDIDRIKDSYRPIRGQVDYISKACSNLEKNIR